MQSGGGKLTVRCLVKSELIIQLTIYLKIPITYINLSANIHTEFKKFFPSGLTMLTLRTKN